VIPLLHTAISERFGGAARDEALYKSMFTLLYFTETLTDRLTHGETTSDNIAHEQVILYHLCSHIHYQTD